MSFFYFQKKLSRFFFFYATVAAVCCYSVLTYLPKVYPSATRQGVCRLDKVKAAADMVCHDDSIILLRWLAGRKQLSVGFSQPSGPVSCSLIGHEQCQLRGLV